MELQIIYILYLQMDFYYSLAEWIEISKTPAAEANKSAVKPKINNIENYTIPFEEIQEGNINEQSYVNKIFTDESVVEERLNKDDDSVENKNENHSGFIPYIQNIQSTLIRNAHQGVKSKISLLQRLKYNLLFNIKEKISNLWKPTTSREARQYGKDEEHLDFPSNEGALMTIGFLTFAVFLIKLVLKLIYALKYKNNNGANGTPIIVGRRKRDVLHEEATKILQLIEEYKFI